MKRPMLYFLAAFLAGYGLAGQPAYLSICFLLALFLFIIQFLMDKKQKDNNTGWYWILLIPLFFILALFLVKEEKENVLAQSDLHDKARIEATGTVIGISDSTNGKKLFIKQKQIRFLDEKLSYHASKRLQHCQIYIYDSSSSSDAIMLGNEIYYTGRIAKWKPASNPGQFNEFQFYLNKRIPYKIYAEKIQVLQKKKYPYRQFLVDLKQKLTKNYHKMLNEKQAGIITAMLLGEKQSIDSEIKELYQKNGISHILAISGLHISFLGGMVYQILRKLLKHQGIASGLTAFFLISYGILSGSSVSTNRAIWMMLLGLTANLLGRTYDLLSGASFTALILLIQNPLQLQKPGFLLSFGAVFGIGGLLPVFLEALKDIPKFFLKYLEAAFVSLSVILTTLPVLCSSFYEIPLYSILINLFILPIFPFILALSFFAGFIGILSISIGKFLLGSVSFLLMLYEGLCRIFAALPGSLWITGQVSGFKILIFYLCIAVFLCAWKLFKKKYYLILFAGFLFLVIPFPQSALEITAVDVGQGDAIFLHIPSKINCLIDGGSSDVKNVGKYRILPFLKAKGIHSLDYIFVSHTDADHLNGILELLEQKEIKICRLVLPDLPEPDKEYQNLEKTAKQKKIQLVYLIQGDKLKIKSAILTCIHPNLNYRTDGKNGYSMVLSLSYRGFNGLFTGDLEEDGERELLKEENEKWLEDNYNLLKVAHHGSKYSSKPEFLKRISPLFSIISCGENNHYGHPAIETLENLSEYGSQYKITKDAGAITVLTNGKVIKIKTYLDSYS